MEKIDTSLYFRRFVFIMCVIFAVLIAYIISLMQLQIKQGDSYYEQAVQRTATQVSITAARGEIVDRYGRAIAQNRMGYNIVFNYADMKKDSRNEIIYQLTQILSENGEEWIDNCPIVISSSGEASFIEEEETAISKMKSTLTLQSYATAQNCLDTMNEQYEVGNLAPDIARIIMGVRLNMEYMAFSNANPYTFAEDVSLETAQRILENSQLLPGVEIAVVPIREYTNGLVAPHLIGVTGPIYAEEYAELKSKGYGYNDVVGKFGIEKEYEDYLRGTSGKRSIIRDDSGEIIYDQITREPVAGNTIVLTLDSELQLMAQKSLEETVKAIAHQGAADNQPLTGEDAHAGAVVVFNVQTFEVLAAVTYPSYDLNTYSEKYNELLKDPSSPLYNRAFNGTYAPGSSFKPAVALAGLQTGKITPNETITCNGTYVLDLGNGSIYDDLGCMHSCGTLNVVQAISQSCNIFFYETGRRVDIQNLNDYCRQLGFGLPTGVGLGESSGRLAGREDREARDENWYFADTLTASIGQNDNKFTPLQLCAYISTIANGGTRYEARLIKTIKSYDMTETVVEDTSENPVVLNELNVEKTYISTVKQGMLSVTQEGTASGVFTNYGVNIGGKTGSVDTDKRKYSSNGVFLAFGPFEEPEIAIAIIGERCVYGSYMVQVARDIFDEYFFSTKTSGYNVLQEGQFVA